ncbi:hypothetical protein GX830_01855, partial [Candidatus Dojkabacteria bacterium]|nr:hypothetical protein [Candidatus Dojkabacteria bacterium]
ISISTAAFSALIGYVANLGDFYFDLSMRAAGGIMMLSAVLVLLLFTVKNRRSNGGKSKSMVVSQVAK